ncbi:MAG: riboflavin synthase [Cyanobacteria bacterium P01_H01_bin.121]
MFTGLVQALGQPRFLNDYQVEILFCHDTQMLRPNSHQGLAAPLAVLAIGDSVAVDGICLTVETLLPKGFIAATSPETLQKTTLAHATNDRLVNLEGSLQVGSKLGGHFVTGHVDGCGHLLQSLETAQAWELSFAVPEPNIQRYIVTKGSIAINGVSLTIATCAAQGDHFSVAVIPHTYNATNLQYLQPGDPVNLEADILGKYVERFLKGTSGVTPLGQTTTSIEEPQPLTLTFLNEHGYQ